MTAPLRISAKDNPLLQRLRKLQRDGAGYRKTGEVWLEGEHLCSALLQRGRRPAQAVLAESAWAQPALQALAQAAPRVVLVPDLLFAGLSALPSPAGIGFLLPLPAQPAIEPRTASVVLDRLQDAGNVGSILRTAAAFGVMQVLALQGTAALWSPKVLRAGMGAHFGLRLVEGLQADGPGRFRKIAAQIELPVVRKQGTGRNASGWLALAMDDHAAGGAHDLAGLLTENVPAFGGDLGDVGIGVHFRKQHQPRRVIRIDGNAMFDEQRAVSRAGFAFASRAAAGGRPRQIENPFAASHPRPSSVVCPCAGPAFRLVDRPGVMIEADPQRQPRAVLLHAAPEGRLRAVASASSHWSGPRTSKSRESSGIKPISPLYRDS